VGPKSASHTSKLGEEYPQLFHLGVPPPPEVRPHIASDLLLGGGRGVVEVDLRSKSFFILK